MKFSFLLKVTRHFQISNFGVIPPFVFLAGTLLTLIALIRDVFNYDSCSNQHNNRIYATNQYISIQTFPNGAAISKFQILEGTLLAISMVDDDLFKSFEVLLFMNYPKPKRSANFRKCREEVRKYCRRTRLWTAALGSCDSHFHKTCARRKPPPKNPSNRVIKLQITYMEAPFSLRIAFGCMVLNFCF